MFKKLIRDSRIGLCCILAAATLFAVRMQAQGTSTATIVGTVTDSSGAAVVGATVQAKNVGTGAVQTATTDAQGRYRVPNLNIGTYDVNASNPGFQGVVHPNITLTVGSEPVVDFALAVGQAQQAITVQGDVSL